MRTHFTTSPGGILRIGNGVTIGAGAAIAATSRIEIGDGARLGRAVMLMNSDYHDPDDRAAAGSSAPIEIGARATLGDGVTVLKGSRIGASARIAAGSVVSGFVAEGAAFPPVRASRPSVPSHGADVAAEIGRVLEQALALPRALRLDEHPSALEGWDSLAALRLVVSLEAAFGVELPAAEVAKAPNLAAIAEIVASRLAD